MKAASARDPRCGGRGPARASPFEAEALDAGAPGEADHAVEVEMPATAWRHRR